jgi:hypothetical protein
LIVKRVFEIIWSMPPAVPLAVSVWVGFKPRSVRHLAQFDFFSLLDVAVLGIFRTLPPGEKQPVVGTASAAICQRALVRNIN